MKKITSKEPITFRVDGAPGNPNSNVLHIDKDGCITDDVSAKIAQDRLGGNITVTDISAKEAVKMGKKMSDEKVEKTVLDEINDKDSDKKLEEEEKEPVEKEEKKKEKEEKENKQ